MKKIITVIILLFLFSFPVSADVYSEQFDLSGADNLTEETPKDVQDIFDSLGIDIREKDWVNKINTENIFSVIGNFIIDSGKTPLRVGASVIALILIISAFSVFGGNDGKFKTSAQYIAVLSISAMALIPLFTVIISASRAIKAGAQFMLSFIPIYCTVIFASGKPVTSAVSGGILLAASEGLVQLSSGVITTLIGSYLSICICSSVSPVINESGLADLIKKMANWSIGLISTVYLGVLSIQTTVNAAADTLAVKTGKFLIGSFVPVVGGVMSEALGTVQSCVSLLKTSIGMYGIVVLVLILVPVIIELLLWRLALCVSAGVAAMFDCKSIVSVLRSADAAVSLLLGIMLLCSLGFIISVTVIAAAGG